MLIKLFLMISVAGQFSLLTACKSRLNATSDSKNITAHYLHHNQAVLFGSPQNLTGPNLDVDHMSTFLRDTSQGGFEGIKGFKNATKSTILKETLNAGILANRGTLFVYFSGHGGRDGHLADHNGDSFYPRELVKPLVDAGLTLSRIVFVIDACYSGNLVDGQTQAYLADPGVTGGNIASIVKSASDVEIVANSISNQFIDAFYDDSDSNIVRTNSGNKTGTALSEGSATRIYNSLSGQVIVITSSSRVENSLDSSTGGDFTNAFLEVANRQDSKGGDINLSDFVSSIDRVAKRTPKIRTIPAQLLKDEMLFEHKRLTESLPTNQPSPLPPSPSPAPSTSGVTISSGGGAGSQRQFTESQLQSLSTNVNGILTSIAREGRSVSCEDLRRIMIQSASEAWRSGGSLNTMEIGQVTSVASTFNCRY